MVQSLNVAKKHIVEYSNSGWFYGYEGSKYFHKLLSLLDIHYSSQTDNPEYETDFEVERESLNQGLEKLQTIARGGEVDWVDAEDVTNILEKAYLTISECIDCFKWLLNKSDKENEKDWIFVSFF